MSESSFINLFRSGITGDARASLEEARAAVLPGAGWMGTVEVGACCVLRWHPNPDLTAASRPASANPPSDLTDAEIREAREVIRVARALRGGGA